MSEVLALKYRPRSFDKLIGQESVRVTLSQALDSNRLSHAYLFSGLRGSGKTSTARIFAKALLCDEGPTSTPCEKCPNCMDANEGRHIDIIEMDGASSRKIDDIRALIEQTKYKPNSSRFKIFIIDEVHMLTREAFNALLKTLEEPPSYVKFILATTDPLKLPATILSRTQHFRFKKIASSEVVKHLSHILNKENIPFEEDAIKIITRAGNGSLRDTLTLLDQAIIYTNSNIDAKSVANMLGVLDPDFFESLLDAILKSDKDKVISYLNELEEYEAEVIIDEFISYIKELFLQKDSRLTLLLVDRYFRILSSTKNLLTISSDNLFILTLTFFKMIEANKLKDIDEVIESIESEVMPLSSKEIEKVELKPIPKESKSLKKEEPFDKLLKLLYDRNYELGECFKGSITLDEFRDNTLFLNSNAKESCKDILRKSSAIIKHFVQECYGIGVKISIKHSKNLEEEIKKNSTKEIKEESNASSCIANQVIGESKEENPQNLLEHPFVKTATELFDPKRIVVKPKV